MPPLPLVATATETTLLSLTSRLSPQLPPPSQPTMPSPGKRLPVSMPRAALMHPMVTMLLLCRQEAPTVPVQLKLQLVATPPRPSHSPASPSHSPTSGATSTKQTVTSGKMSLGTALVADTYRVRRPCYEAVTRLSARLTNRATPD